MNPKREIEEMTNQLKQYRKSLNNHIDNGISLILLIDDKIKIKEKRDILKNHITSNFCHRTGTKLDSDGNGCTCGFFSRNDSYDCVRKGIKLNVPFHKKDYAKSLGAKWQPTLKMWYVNYDSSNAVELHTIFNLNTEYKEVKKTKYDRMIDEMLYELTLSFFERE